MRLYRRKQRLNDLTRKESLLPANPRYAVSNPQLICSATISLLRPALAQPTLRCVQHIANLSPRLSNPTNPMIHCWVLTSLAAPSHLPPVARLARYLPQRHQVECLGQTSNSRFCPCTQSRNPRRLEITSGAAHSATWPLLLSRHRTWVV